MIYFFTSLAIIISLFMPASALATNQNRYLSKWIELLKNGNENEKKIALKELRFLEYPEYRKDIKVFDPILQALKDKDPSVRAAAAASLKRIGELSKGCCKETEIVPSLIKALEDNHSRVREEAAKALAYYKDKRVVDPLIKTLNDKDPWVRLSAVFSLGELGKRMLTIGVQPSSSGGVAFLSAVPSDQIEKSKIRIPITKEDIKPQEIRRYDSVSGELGAEKALDPLLKLLDDNSDWRNKFIQQEAVITIRKMWNFDKKVVSLLIKKYNDDYLRAEILKTLGKFEAIEAKDIILQATKNSNEKIRRLAAEAFLKLPVTAATKEVGIFIKLLKDPAIEVRIPSAEVLGKLGDNRAVNPLIELLQDSKKDVKQTAIAALGNFSDTRIFDAIINYGITDSDAKTRESSIKTFIAVAKKTRKEIVYVYRKGGKRYITNEISEDGRYVYFPRNISYYKEHIIHPIAVDKLIKALKSPDPNIVGNVLNIIGEFEDNRIEGCLIKLLNAQSPEVRKKSASLLYDFGTEKAVPELINLLKDNDKNVKAEAIKALKAFQVKGIAESEAERLQNEKVFEAILEKLNDNDEEVRAMALASLGDFDDPRVLDLSISLLKDKSAFVKGRAISNIKKMPDKRAVEPLISLLNDKDSRIAQEAAGLLGIIGDKRAAEPLINVLNNELNKNQGSYLLEIIVSALGRIGDERAVPVLIKAFNHNKRGYELRKNTVMALGLIKDKRSIPVLIEALSDNNLRHNAIEALGNIGDPSTLNVLKGYLEDNNLKHITISAIGNIKDDKALQIVIDSLNSRDYSLMDRAIESLGKRKDRRAIKPLLKLVGRDTGRHLMVKRALNEYKDPAMVDIIRTFLTDEDLEVKKGAIIFLGIYKDAKASPLLIDIIKSNQGHLKPNAIVALGEIGDKNAVDILLKILLDSNEIVSARDQSARALGKFGDTKIAPTLIGVIKNKAEHKDIREGAAVALGGIKSKQAVEPLIEVLNDKEEDSQLKIAVVTALGNIGDERAIEPIEDVLKSTSKHYLNYYLRDAAQIALSKIKK